MQYEIMQIKEIKKCEYAWCGFDDALENGFSLNHYKSVYSGVVEGNDAYQVLEDLFYIFNCNHPEDYKAHSLSVSDVVFLDGNYYYCDRFGWKLIEGVKKGE